MTLAHGRIGHRLHRDDPAVPGADGHLASRAAVRARRPRPGRSRAERGGARVLQRSGRTRVDTRAATHARALAQVGSVRSHSSLRAAVLHVPDELSLELVADPHASIAIDAPRHVDGDERMRRIDETRLCRAIGGIDDAELLQIPVKRFVWTARDGIGRIAGCQRSQDEPSEILNLRRVGPDFHPIGQGRRAGGHQPGRPGNLDEAQPAGARWREPVVVAQRRHVNPRRAQERRGRTCQRAVCALHRSQPHEAPQRPTQATGLFSSSRRTPAASGGAAIVRMTMTIVDIGNRPPVVSG